MSSPVPIPRPPPIPAIETYREKAVRKFKQNPWVPLGCLATVGALCVAMVKMRRGHSQSFNHWLRVRVAAQGLTIVALVAGTYSMRPQDEQSIVGGIVGSEDLKLNPKLNPTRNGVDVERRRVEKVNNNREKEEFEERLRGAEEMHELEVLLARGSRGAGQGPKSVNDDDDEPRPGEGKSSSWAGWFGWGRGASKENSSKGSDDENKKS